MIQPREILAMSRNLISDFSRFLSRFLNGACQGVNGGGLGEIYSAL